MTGPDSLTPNNNEHLYNLDVCMHVCLLTLIQQMLFLPQGELLIKKQNINQNTHMSFHVHRLTSNPPTVLFKYHGIQHFLLYTTVLMFIIILMLT